MDFKQEEINVLFQEIDKNYFSRNFGSMSKADLETLLFSCYIEHCINNGLPFDDYSVSKTLGITQNRVRTLKERKELKYPKPDFDWREAILRDIKNMKYDENHKVKFIVQDVNVMNEARNYIETHGWYDECSLNKKLLVLPLDCFVELFVEDEFEFTPELLKKIKTLKNKERAVIEFTKDFTKEGLKNFMMTASKEAMGVILKAIPFWGLAEVMAKALIEIIKK